MEKITGSTVLVIFGVTGDLAQRKLLPALVDLDAAEMLPKELHIIGFSRRDLSSKKFLGFVREVIAEKTPTHPPVIINRFLKRLSYCQALFDDPKAYERLGEAVLSLEEKKFKKCANKLYYLATPPEFYETIFRQLADSGLTIPCGGGEGWARVLVEKPFGKDINEAEKLDALLGKLFKEEQIFRIDHYLAKETLQNLIAFRFSNNIFEPIWSSKYIEKVKIRLLEKSDVGNRGSFYDGIGALRDVGQNHLLQMLALIAMERPAKFDVAGMRQERTKVAKSLFLCKGDIARCVTRGQYEEYRQHQNVSRSSTTETYFKIETKVRNARWRGTTFTLESGKALKDSRAEITLYFKAPRLCISCGEKPCVHRNTLTFHIQPDEGITLKFWIKRPGFEHELAEKELSFSYQHSPDIARLPDAYEKLLFDALAGDQTLFASTEETRAAWKFVTSILKRWQKTQLMSYKKGTFP